MVRVFFLTVLYEAQLVQNVTGWSRIVQNELCWYDLIEVRSSATSISDGIFYLERPLKVDDKVSDKGN